MRFSSRLSRYTLRRDTSRSIIYECCGEAQRASPFEIVSRDRQGLYAEGARIGGPQARQVADRFHLILNSREVIENQLGGLGRPLRTTVSVAAEVDDTRAGLRRVLQAKFEQVRRLYDAGRTVTVITQELGLSRKRVDKWIRFQF